MRNLEHGRGRPRGTGGLEEVERESAAPVPATVLVVDDEPLLRTVMKRALLDEGYAVITAANANEALALAVGGTRPDLVLTDLLMPGMDGVELERRFHAFSPATPFVFMSAVTDAAQIARLGQREGGSVLEKPFELDNLASCVRSALSRAMAH
jgi:CheY-like chemotaxis protein